MRNKYDGEFNLKGGNENENEGRTVGGKPTSCLIDSPRGSSFYCIKKFG